ncbi:rhomboid protein 1 [Carex littledalei]|uniref:Rhomboid protein 1 n=1 Tax=Carex littledalei TaxID=544730 RepID=A0A833RB38_9POAL|nr:rhomboid protein 1 [Carex littledalei]
MKIITARLLFSQSHLRLLLNPNKQPLSLFSPPPSQQKPLSLMLKCSWQFRQRYTTTTTVHMGTLLLTTGSRLLSSSTWQHHAAMNLLSLSKFWLHRIRSPDKVVFYLVGANVAVFILWKNADPSFMIKHFTISWDNFTSGRLHTLITGAFSHYKPSHLINNMIGLYIFGQTIANIFGTMFLLKMYVGGAVSGSIFYLVHRAFVDYNQVINLYLNNIYGASAAVNAIILLSVFLFPRSVIYYDFFIPLPAAMLGAIHIGTDLWRVYEGDRKISGAGHLGGAFVGVVVCARIRRWI